MRSLAVLSLSIAFSASLVSVALADGPAGADAKKSDWKFTLGAGAMVAPTYEGSKHYDVQPMPIAEVSWRDMISLGTKDGLKVVLRPLPNQGFSVNGGIGYWGGRREGADKDNGDALRGLGNLSGGAVGKLGVGYQYQAASIGLEVARDLGNDRDGTTVTLNGGYKIFKSQRFNVNGDISTTWADDNYMSNIFGITQDQANRSLKHYSAYTAGSGLKDVTFGLNADYLLTGSVSLFGMVGVARLLDDAADSPIVKSQGSATQINAGLGLMYHF